MTSSHARMVEAKEKMEVDRLDALLLCLFMIGFVALAAFAGTIFHTRR